MTTTTTERISAVCSAYFGAYRGAGRWSPPNRCDSCPLRAPCMTRGAAPARTDAELADNRRVFEGAAEAILAVIP